MKMTEVLKVLLLWIYFILTGFGLIYFIAENGKKQDKLDRFDSLQIGFDDNREIALGGPDYNIEYDTTVNYEDNVYTERDTITIDDGLKILGYEDATESILTISEKDSLDIYGEITIDAKYFRKITIYGSKN